MRYRLIAIDLDGTLLDRKGHISRQNLSAIARAQCQGALIVPCTGRLWLESRQALALMLNVQTGVFVTGAAVCDIDTGASLDIAVIEPHLAHELVRYLHDLPEAVLVCRESALCGHDYMVTGSGTLTPNTQWWFEASGATVHFQDRVTADDLHHTLRIALVAEGSRVPVLCQAIRQAFRDRVLVHTFQAVQTPDPSQGVHVLEIFAAGVDKWRGLDWIAQQRGITPEQIAAIGDEINDVAMLRSAGCGIAMANATDAAKQAADQVTLACDQDGVAHAIDQLLSGRWDG